MPGRKPTYEDLAARLAEAEEVIATLRNGDADAVIGDRSVMLLRLYEAERHLQCLYGLSDLANRHDITLDDLLAGMADLLPPFWRYPKTACARVTLDGREFTSKDFEASSWKQSADILVDGKPAGRVEIFYREAKPGRDEGPFTKEERDLLNAMAERLGRIIERRRSDNETRSQKEFLEIVLESVSAPFLVINANNYTVKMANSAARQFGKFAETTKCHELTHDDPQPCGPDDHPCPLKLVKATGKPAVVEHLHRAADGAARYYEVRGYPIFDSSGEVVEMIEYMTDVTERRLVVDALFKSEEKYRSLTGNIPGMVYRALPDWSVEFISNSEDVCGYTVDEFFSPDFNWPDIIHPDDRETVAAEASTLGEGRKNIVQEYRIFDKSGAVRWVEDRKVAQLDNDGRLKGVDGVVIDITERKQAEAELVMHRDHLEKLVEERSAALMESELRLTREANAVAAIIDSMLHGEIDEKQTEDRVLNACLAATDSVYGMIGWINDDGKFDTTVYDSRTLNDCAFPEAEAWHLTTGMTIRGVWGSAMLKGEPIICNDPAAHPDSVGLPGGHVPINCFLGVPLKDGSTTVGMVAVANKPGDTPRRIARSWSGWRR